METSWNPTTLRVGKGCCDASVMRVYDRTMGTPGSGDAPGKVGNLGRLVSPLAQQLGILGILCILFLTALQLLVLLTLSNGYDCSGNVPRLASHCFVLFDHV